MALKLIKFALLLMVAASLTSCVRIKRHKVNPIAQTQMIVRDQAWLMQVQPDNLHERLVLTPATFRNGVYVCAIENLSKPCLPKLSALVADRLEQKGIVVVSDQSMAAATLYFEAWFDSFSSHANVQRPEKGVLNNPTEMGKDFAAKIERSLETGFPPEVHKRFRAAANPFASVTLNVNDDQKYIYLAFTAIDMDEAAPYQGEGANHIGASNNPWVSNDSRRSRWRRRALAPPMRTLVGNYNGTIPTEQAALPMLKDGIDLLIERMGKSPNKSRRKK